MEIVSKFRELSKRKYFDDIYTLILAVVALIGWCFSSTIGISLLFLSAIVVLLLTKDLSYLIPNTIYSIFTINKDFSSNEIPLSLIIIGSIYILLLIVQIVINGIHLKRMKSWIGLCGLAVANMIPIFYAKIPDGRNIFYIFFFIDAIYFAVYLIFVNAIKRDALNLIAHTMAWLGVLISIECIIRVVTLNDGINHIFDLYYKLGWSDSNAAGVMICMSIPFTYYILGRLNNTWAILLNHLKVMLMCIGIIFASCKGAYIFGMGEALILVIALFHYSEHRLKYGSVTGVYLATIMSIFMIMCVPTYFLFKDVHTYILEGGVSQSDKLVLWQRGIEEWTRSPLTIFFGSGFACVIETTPAGGVSPVVFHSAFIETLVVGGILALIFLLIHYLEKYRAVKKIGNKLFKITMLTGLIGVDLYSTIDNTYHMYYCMIPFVITMAVIDSTIYLDSIKYQTT